MKALKKLKFNFNSDNSNLQIEITYQDSIGVEGTVNKSISNFLTRPKLTYQTIVIPNYGELDIVYEGKSNYIPIPPPEDDPIRPSSQINRTLDITTDPISIQPVNRKVKSIEITPSSDNSNNGYFDAKIECDLTECGILFGMLHPAIPNPNVEDKQHPAYFHLLTGDNLPNPKSNCDIKKFQINSHEKYSLIIRDIDDIHNSPYDTNFHKKFSTPIVFRLRVN